MGDTIYEYAENVYPAFSAKVRSTVADPPNEIVSLDDYRRRHRESASDPSFQNLNAKARTGAGGGGGGFRRKRSSGSA